MKSLRLWVLVILMLGTATLLYARGDVDHVPASQPLSELPKTIGSLNSVDVPIDAEALAKLGNGMFLNRVYVAPAQAEQRNAAAQVGLYIGYFPTQRTGQSIHSPQNCLPGAGWVFDKSGLTSVRTGTGKEVQVGEYVISNGAIKMEVLYWYQQRGRAIADDYAAKLYTLADSIRYGRTDAALIRIMTPITATENGDEAHQRAVDFAEQLEPLLPAYIPN